LGRIFLEKKPELSRLWHINLKINPSFKTFNPGRRMQTMLTAVAALAAFGVVFASEWVDLTEDVLMRADALREPPPPRLSNDPIIGASSSCRA
jgi:hypothetical protein